MSGSANSNETPETILKKASYSFQNGDIKLARSLANEVISKNPYHPGANHFLGVIAAQQGVYDQAIQLFKVAITNKPEHPLYHQHLGLAFHMMGNMKDAENSYEQAIKLSPQNAEARYNYGNLLRDLRQYDKALKSYENAVVLNPNHGMALNNIGIVLSELGRLGESISYYLRSIDVNPLYASPYINQCVALIKLNRLNEALDICDKAIKHIPGDAMLHNIRGSILYQLGRDDESLEACDASIKINPHFAEAYKNRGITLSRLNRHDGALESINRSIQLKPDDAQAHSSRGVILTELGFVEDAIQACEYAISLEDNNANSYMNLAVSLNVYGDLEKSKEAYLKALSINSNNAETHNNYAMLLLQSGEFENGWKEYEWRWKVRSFPNYGRIMSCKQWSGEKLASGAIFIHAEQGLGDTLQFIRYIPHVRNRCGGIIFESQAALMSLLSDYPGIDKLIKHGEAIPEHTVHAPLMSLPFILGTTLDSIPGDVPYLKTPKLASNLRTELGFREDKKNVGIVWAGSPLNRNDRSRSVELLQFRSLIANPDINCISLQYGDRVSDIKNTSGMHTLVDTSAYLGDFRTVASAMKELDLVISVDTVFAHLAGALGLPVWVLLSDNPDWRWMLETDTSPWYPSMRLFRQSRRGTWDDVLENVSTDLSDNPPWKYQ